MAQDMVSVTLTGLRLATSAADTAAVAGAAAGLENEFISSITVGLVTGREFVARRPTKKLQHISGAGKRLAADLLQMARGARTRGQSPQLCFQRLCYAQTSRSRPEITA